ncbi:hypothetical protein [Vibrio phage PhiImVa-1]|nr:hypothetical protein [Vibrio phage PhiImVa-1]
MPLMLFILPFTIIGLIAALPYFVGSMFIIGAIAAIIKGILILTENQNEIN